MTRRQPFSEINMRTNFAIQLLSIVLTGGFMTMPATLAAERLSYPQTRRVEQFDDFHGTRVADPYRWLEDDVRESSEVAAWVEAQNKVTFAHLEDIPARETLRKRLTELWNYEKF